MENTKIAMGYRNVASLMVELELQWLLHLKLKDKIQRNGMKLTFAAYIYWLWRSRNEKILKGKDMSV